jgi:hypothetical protein
MRFSAKSFITILAGSLIVIPAWRPGIADVTYPAGYRNWTHVKSAFMGPAHASYNTLGGFRHVYANGKAMEGYRTRVFPEGSVIAFDYFQASDSAGFFSERERRQVDVMEKDSSRFAATGGWGFQRFAPNSARVNAPSSQQCFACHDRLKTDGLVISRYRE